MKNKFLSMLAFAAAAVAFTACDDDNEGLTRITYYPSITLEGDSYIVHQKGEPFVDPGYTSFLGGEDVTDGVTVVGQVDVDQSGIYTLTYRTVANADGFSGSTSRTVVVLDLTDPIEGFYTAAPGTQRSDAGVAYSGYSVLIYQRPDGLYFVDDLLAGWYRDRAGYGDSYALKGIIGVNDDGTVDLYASAFDLWAYEAEGWSDATFQDGTFRWSFGFEGLTWDVVLVKD